MEHKPTAARRPPEPGEPQWKHWVRWGLEPNDVEECLDRKCNDGWELVTLIESATRGLYMIVLRRFS